MSDIITKDCNGKPLEDGDTVHLTKDLKVKGSTTTLKRGNPIKNIRLIDDEQHVEVRVGKATFVLKTEFLKKA
jgi:protein PhnA